MSFNERNVDILSPHSTAFDSPEHHGTEKSFVASCDASSVHSFSSIRPPLSLTNLFRRGGASPPGAGDSSGRFSDRDSLCARVAIVGDSDSGRTAVAAGAVKIGPPVRTAADYVSASAGSCLTYAYRAAVSKRREVLHVSVMDAGPIPLRGGPSRRALPSCDAVLLTFALTSVKQHRKGGHALFSFLGSSGSSGASVIIHRSDRLMLRALFASVAARVKRGSRSPMVSLIGTYKNLLSDQSRPAVELVLRELRAICTEAVALLGVPLAVHSVFAVSAVDGTCVSENRGGPETIAAMWAFVCDVLLKDMGSKQAVEGYTEALWARSFPFRRLYEEEGTDKTSEGKEKSEDDIEACTETGFPVLDVLPPPVTSPVKLTINCVHSRLVRIILHAKMERKIVFVHFSTLWRTTYAFGALGEAHLLVILEQLSATGEIALFYHQPSGLPGRERCVCLHPCLIERAQATVYLYASYARDRREDRGKLLSGIDLDACRRLHTSNNVARGVFSQSILLALTPQLQLSRAPSITTEIFALLLLLSDTAFVRPSRRLPPSPPPPKTSISFYQYNSSFSCDELSANSLAPVADGTLTNNSIRMSHESLNCLSNESDSLPLMKWELSKHLEFVLPALIESECPRELVCCARRLASASATDSALHGYCAASRLLGLRDIPVDFFPSLICRIYPYVDPATPIYGQALWLSSSALARHASNSSGEQAKSNMLLRAFVALTGRDDGESLLEIHAFCEGGGRLPMALLMNEVTGHVAQLLERDFPGVVVRAVSELPSDVKDALGKGTEGAGGKFLGVSTVSELDTAIRSAAEV